MANDKHGRVEHAPGIVTQYLSSPGPLGFAAGYYYDAETKRGTRCRGPYETRKAAREAALNAQARINREKTE